MKFRDVFNLRFSPKSFMNVREVNLEEIRLQVHDLNQSQHICIEQWLRINLV